MIPSPRIDGSSAPAIGRDQLMFRPGVTYRVNYLVAALLLIGTIASVFGIITLHRHQMQRLADIYLSRADQALKEGNRRESIRQVAAYLSLRPNDVDAQVRLAIERSRAARNSVEATHALVDLEDTVRRLPGRTEPRRELVDLLLAFGRERDALKNLEFLLKATPDDKDIQLLLGKIQLQSGDRDQAIATLEQLIETAPKMTAAYAPLLESLREQEEYWPRAEGLVARLLAENGDSAEALLICARDSRRRGGMTEALGYARRAVALAPENEEALILVSDLVWLESNSSGPLSISDAELKQLSATFTDLVDHASEKPSVFVAIAQLEMARRDPISARRWLEKGLESCEDRKPLQFCLVETMIEGGAFDEACDLISTLEEGGGDRRALVFMRARAEMSVGRWASAAERLRGLRGNVHDRPELAFQVERSLALCFEQLHHQAWELAALERALELDRWSYQARIRVARILAERREFDDAIYHCRFLQAEHDVTLPLAAILIDAALERPREERSLGEATELLDLADQRAGSAGARSTELRIHLLTAEERWSDAAALAATALARFPDDASLWNTGLGLLIHDQKQTEAAALVDDWEKRHGLSTATVLARLRLTLQTPGKSTTAEARLNPIAALAANLEGPQRAEVEMALARASEELQNDNLADRFWNKAITATPDDVRPWRGMLELSLRRGDEKESQSCIDRLRRIEGTEGVYWRFGVVHLAIRAAENGDRSRIAEAEETLLSVIRVMPTNPEVTLLQARVADLRGQFSQSTDFLLDAYERGSRSLELAIEVVRRLSQRQRFADAESFITKHRLPSEFERSSELAKLAAEISVQLSDRETAIERSRQVVDREPRSFSDLLWQAALLEQAGVADQAGAVLETACQLAPSEPSVWVARGSWLIRNGQESEGRALLKTALESVAESRRLLLRAQWEESLGEPSAAAKMYLEGLAAAPDDRETQLAAAAFFLRTGDVLQSERLWRELLTSTDSNSPVALATIRRGLAACLLLKRQYPALAEGLALLARNAEKGENPGDRRIRARILASMPDAGQRRQALEELQHIEETATLTDDDQILLVQTCLSLGDWAGARRELIALTIRRPNDLRALQLAFQQFLAHNEDLEYPEEWLRRIRELQPVAPSTRELSLLMLAAEGADEEALESLRQWSNGLDETGFETEKPALNFARLAESLGDWFDRHGKNQQAQPFWSEAERLYRRDASQGDERRMELVQYLIRRRRLDEAHSLLEQLGEHVPPAQFVAAATQIAFFSDGRTEACQASRRLIDRRWNVSMATDLDVLFGVASLAQLEGNFVEAESLCRRVLASDPRSIAACNDLAFLLSVRSNRHAEALELIDRALAAGGRIGWLLDTRATVLRRAGKRDEALSAMQELIADESTPTRRFHLAQALRDSGRDHEARVALNAAIESGLTEINLHPLERDDFREMKRRYRAAPAETSLHQQPSEASCIAAPLAVNSLTRGRTQPWGATKRQTSEEIKLTRR